MQIRKIGYAVEGGTEISEFDRFIDAFNHCRSVPGYATLSLCWGVEKKRVQELIIAQTHNGRLLETSYICELLFASLTKEASAKNATQTKNEVPTRNETPAPSQSVNVQPKQEQAPRKTLEECKKLWNPKTRYFPVPVPALIPPPMTQVGPLAFVVDSDAPWTFPEQETIELKDLFISAVGHLLYGYRKQGLEFLELTGSYCSEVVTATRVYLPLSYWFDSSLPQPMKCASETALLSR